MFIETDKESLLNPWSIPVKILSEVVKLPHGEFFTVYFRDSTYTQMFAYLLNSFGVSFLIRRDSLSLKIESDRDADRMLLAVAAEEKSVSPKQPSQRAIELVDKLIEIFEVEAAQAEKKEHNIH